MIKLIVIEEDELRRLIREELSFKTPKVESIEIKKRLSRKEAAEFLDVSYMTMYNWVKSGRLKEHGIGKKRFFLKNELIEALENKTK